MITSMFAGGADEATAWHQPASRNPREPLPHAGQRLDAAPTHHVAVGRFLGLSEARNLRRRDALAEIPPQDGIVALPEPRRELLVGERVPLPGQRVAPREPVVFGRIDQRAVHVPQNGARTVYRFCSPLTSLPTSGSHARRLSALAHRRPETRL